MPRPKKTFNVEEFRCYVNTQLKRTDDFANDDFKAGFCVALEHVLHCANRYKGYSDNYWLEKGCREWEDAGRPDFPEKNKFIFGPTGQKYNRIYF